jgi:hypothetical protein
VKKHLTGKHVLVTISGFLIILGTGCSARLQSYNELLRIHQEYLQNLNHLEEQMNIIEAFETNPDPSAEDSVEYQGSVNRCEHSRVRINSLVKDYNEGVSKMGRGAFDRMRRKHPPVSGRLPEKLEYIPSRTPSPKPPDPGELFE